MSQEHLDVAPEALSEATAQLMLTIYQTQPSKARTTHEPGTIQ